MSCDTYTRCPKCQETLREWKEFGYSETENIFSISYSGICRECGFELHFTLSEEEIADFIKKHQKNEH